MSNRQKRVKKQAIMCGVGAALAGAGALAVFAPAAGAAGAVGYVLALIAFEATA